VEHPRSAPEAASLAPRVGSKPASAGAPEGTRAECSCAPAPRRTPVVRGRRKHSCLGRMRPAPRFAFAVLVIAASCIPLRLALAEDCKEVISGDTAQRLYDACRQVEPKDGCALETVRTEQWRATVVWTKDGRLLECVVVAPTACVAMPTVRGNALSATVPPSTAKACPVAVEALGALLAGDTFGTLALSSPPGEALPAPPPPPPACASTSLLRRRAGPAARRPDSRRPAARIRSGTLHPEERRARDRTDRRVIPRRARRAGRDQRGGHPQAQSSGSKRHPGLPGERDCQPVLPQRRARGGRPAQPELPRPTEARSRLRRSRRRGYDTRKTRRRQAARSAPIACGSASPASSADDG
jgi:hypothetical protein